MVHHERYVVNSFCAFFFWISRTCKDHHMPDQVLFTPIIPSLKALRLYLGRMETTLAAALEP